MRKIKKIAISGWEETTDKELIPFIEGYYDKGITKVICTDISRMECCRDRLSDYIRKYGKHCLLYIS